jgi:hypothetical protein
MASPRRRLRTCRANTIFLLPEALVMGDVPA